MGIITNTQFIAPIKENVIDSSGLITNIWNIFFRRISSLLSPLGEEKSFQIENNVSSAADITGMLFEKAQVSQATVEYLVQRVTTGAGATELIESGILIFAYRPTSDAWSKVDVSVNSPSDSGVTFSITSAGQVQYTSSNITGTASISKLYYRARTLAGKNSQYSEMSRGGR